MSSSDEIKTHFRYIDEKLNDLKSDVSEIKESVSEIRNQSVVQSKILEVNTEQLKEHIRRTNALEERVEQTAEAFRNELKPVEDHVKFLNKLAKTISWIVGIGAGIAAMFKYLQ